MLLTLIALIIAGICGINYSMGVFNRAIYKTDYSYYVKQYAKEYNIEPNLIYAVIKTESDFKSKATSNVGARGLMQVMEPTFDWVSSLVKDSNITYDDMFEPEINIKYGAFLLSYLINEFSTYEEAISAYHAGRGAVNSWLKDEKYSSDGQTLDRIPIDDTQHYVNKVIKAYEMYNKLYGSHAD